MAVYYDLAWAAIFSRNTFNLLFLPEAIWTVCYTSVQDESNFRTALLYPWIKIIDVVAFEHQSAIHLLWMFLFFWEKIAYGTIRSSFF